MTLLSFSAQQNAWTLYESGYSTMWIAERIYERYGFKNPASCQAALFRHWRFRRLRDKQQAARARYDGGRCFGCGCPYEDWPQGCDTCIRRHNNPCRVGTRVAPGRTGCSGCGCELDNRSYGCKQCITRHSLRRRRAGKSAAASLLADGRGGTKIKEAA